MKRSIFNLSTALGLLILTHTAYGMDKLPEDEQLPSAPHVQQKDQEKGDEKEGPLATFSRELKEIIVWSLRPGYYKSLSLKQYLSLSRLTKEFNDIAKGTQEIKVPWMFCSDPYKDHKRHPEILLPISIPPTFFQNFTRLAYLDLTYSQVVNDNDDCLRQLASTCTTLIGLNLYSNKKIGSAVALFTTLKQLDLGMRCGVPGQYLAPLTGLKTLDLAYNVIITDSDLTSLTGLTCLNACGINITSQTLTRLTGLQKLYITDKHEITDEGLTTLKNLESLIIEEDVDEDKRLSFTMEGLRKLPNLKHLTLWGDSVFHTEGLVGLTGLKTLTVEKLPVEEDYGDSYSEEEDVAPSSKEASQPGFYKLLEANDVRVIYFEEDLPDEEKIQVTSPFRFEEQKFVPGFTFNEDTIPVGAVYLSEEEVYTSGETTSGETTSGEEVDTSDEFTSGEEVDTSGEGIDTSEEDLSSD